VTIKRSRQPRSFCALVLFPTTSQTFPCFIVIRAHSRSFHRDASGQTPLEVNKTSIETKLRQLWAEVAQEVGPSSAELQFDHVFELRVMALPSFHHQKDYWLRDVSSMRSMFQNSVSPNYFFEGREQHHSVPCSGFGKYAADAWSAIQADEDLDIPSMQTLLATHKCQSAAIQILKTMRDNLKQNPCRLEAQLFQGGSEAWATWKRMCSNWVSFVCEQAEKGISDFRQATAGYKETAVADELQKFNDAISNEFAGSVGILFDSLLPQALQLFQSDLQKLSGDDPSDDAQPGAAGRKFHSRSQRLLQDTVMAFDDLTTALAELPDRAGSEFVKSTRERMLTSFHQLMLQTRNVEALKLRESVLGKARTALLTPLHALIESPNARLWEKIRVQVLEAQAQGFQIRDVQARDIFGAEVSPADLSSICSESELQSHLNGVVSDDLNVLVENMERLQRIAFDAFDRIFNNHRTKKWTTFDKLISSLCRLHSLYCLHSICA
jgi:hypothetical protein